MRGHGRAQRAGEQDVEPLLEELEPGCRRPRLRAHLITGCNARCSGQYWCGTSAAIFSAMRRNAARDGREITEYDEYGKRIAATHGDLPPERVSVEVPPRAFFAFVCGFLGASFVRLEGGSCCGGRRRVESTARL